jgi:hypothetical protein
MQYLAKYNAGAGFWNLENSRKWRTQKNGKGVRPLNKQKF